MIFNVLENATSAGFDRLKQPFALFYLSCRPRVPTLPFALLQHHSFLHIYYGLE